jgi:hypothetical protein
MGQLHNSSYKGATDLAYLPKDPMVGVARRKVFFPFSAVQYEVQLQVALQHADIERLGPQDIQLNFGPAAIAEEIETWKEVYGIDERRQLPEEQFPSRLQRCGLIRCCEAGWSSTLSAVR